MSRFIPFNRQQQYLLPPSMNEWLPENHLARFIVEVIEQLDLSKLIRRFSGCGSAAYHPAMMLALLVYGYATGIFSSRKIERATYDSVGFRFIAAEQHPDHDTLANFRKTFLVELEDLFVQVLTLAQTMKLVKGQVKSRWMEPRSRPMHPNTQRCPTGILKSWKCSCAKKCRLCCGGLRKRIARNWRTVLIYRRKSPDGKIG